MDSADIVMYMLIHSGIETEIIELAMEYDIDFDELLRNIARYEHNKGYDSEQAVAEVLNYYGYRGNQNAGLTMLYEYLTGVDNETFDFKVEINYYGFTEGQNKNERDNYLYEGWLDNFDRDQAYNIIMSGIYVPQQSINAFNRRYDEDL